MAAFHGLAADGLFMGQTPQFFEVMQELAAAADTATREGLTLRRSRAVTSRRNKYTQSPGLPGLGLGCLCNCVEFSVAIRPKNQAPAIRCTGP